MVRDNTGSGPATRAEGCRPGGAGSPILGEMVASSEIRQFYVNLMKLDDFH